MNMEAFDDILNEKYGIDDAAIFFNLKWAKEVIDAFDPSSDKDINDILEYYFIIMLFAKKIFPKTWDEATIKKYTYRVELFNAIVGKFLSKVNGENLSEYYKQTKDLFKSDFFAAVARYKVTKRISDEQFSSFVKENPYAMKDIIREEKLVKKYGKVIASLLTDKVEYAELVIDYFFVKDYLSDIKTFMPLELGREQKELIIRNYVNWSEANLNYLTLISGLKKADNYLVNDRLRLQAYKITQDICKKLSKNKENQIQACVRMGFCDQNEELNETYDEDTNTEEILYSKRWIAENLDFPTLLNNFIFLFRYVDWHRQCCCHFLSNPNDLDIFDMAGVHGKDEYTTGVNFEYVRKRSNLQMRLYQEELQKHKIEIEDLFKWFFETYLKEEFSVENYKYFSPTPQASNLEKILLIASQLDAVLKQFRLFIDDDKIDRELFAFSSMPYKIVDTPSMLEKKYLYPNSEEIKQDLFYLFSNHCMLGYLEKTDETYYCFAQILTTTNIRSDDYPDDEQKKLKHLIFREIIYVDKKGFLRINNLLLNLLFNIHKDGYLAYHYCSEKEKLIAEKFLKKGDLKAESSLFTRQEKEYLDFMLNVQKFFNGPELRNKYVHGNFSSNPEVHKNDYIELLKIMTLIVIRINEEFNLKYPKKEDEGCLG